MTEKASVADLELIELYFAGKASPAQAAAVREMLERCPEFGGRLEAFRAKLVADAGHPVTAHLSWERFRARAGIVSSVPVLGGVSRWSGRHQQSRPARLPGWYAVLGAVAALSITAAVWLGSSFSLAGNKGQLPGRVLVYATHPGQRADVTLPDGSTAVLNVASRLEVPADFGTRTRTVKLVGAALFTVVHRDAAPFTVLAGNATTRVLGTSFVVRRYPGDSSTVVAVRDGRVAVQTQVVAARQQAEVTHAGTVRVSSADEAQFGFMTGTLTLNWMPLGAAVPELERWYDVRIVLADARLAARPVKASFAEGSATDLASILSLMLHARVEREGRVLTIYPR